MHIVITGASRGVGLALADGYRARGDRVTGTSTRGAGGLLAVDVTRAQDIAAMGIALEAQPVDLLICNAGVYLDKGQDLADGYPPEIWAQELAVNVTGVFLTVQEVLPNLQLADRPRIAIISSQMASHTRASGGSYRAPLKIAPELAAGYPSRGETADGGCDGADGLLRPFGPLREP